MENTLVGLTVELRSSKGLETVLVQIAANGEVDFEGDRPWLFDVEEVELIGRLAKAAKHHSEGGW